MSESPPRPRIALTRRLTPDVEAALQARFDVAMRPEDGAWTPEQLQQLLATSDGVLCTVTDRFTADVLAAYPIRTRIIANFGVGVDNIDLAAAEAHDIVVTNTPDVLTEDTADLAMMLILMTMRRASEGELELRAGRWTGWRPTHMLGTRVKGRRLGIVGMGRIGRAVAQRASRGFGMAVGYFNPSAVTPESVEHLELNRFTTLDALLAESDVVTLHCPSTAETRRLIDRRRLALMKRDAYLINTARGDLIDDDALIDALTNGRLAGAGLDVFRGEPRLDERYLQLPQVTLLPHLGSATTETRAAMGRRALENLTAFFAGHPPPDRVG